ncbi:TIGR02281 family clan AA aspartic protease [Roseivivax sp. GX 12232]|uniref:retropepsin-like aspartic protease family protein n=1 Tax=Roseivivax sp. GX 12232 TaxID=2900547 RepID=UPI001E5A6D59|nr:TIGR02281 family clan AA aspartic protease [Roseivivax sp. GX 12232]MCE0504598.1 TIGR02281 family clan AA aspartic protease [Roseivivax sp. GX 12232]
MDAMDYGQFAYLALLGAVLVFWFFVQDRANLGTKVKALAAWVFIFLGAIAVIGLWDDIRGTVRPQQSYLAEEARIVLPRQADGHYHARLEVNGTPVSFLVDTGASGTVLGQRDAARLGFAPEELAHTGVAETANGSVRTARVTLDSVALGPFEDQNVPAYVTEGALEQSLLGMSYLQRFGRLEIAGDELILER